ncbi:MULTISPECIES: GNAT family N-acetyltransferase [Saccharibacillus]|uniref:GNAT family N-acetyltransferase n=1 Tax=Saccharibacillus brassicae TaxID=2583377 RepID=A0A4Y6UUW5_SACBS|nr:MULTISPECIES: GNAT family N-acetyltransferase [Saccharibacillus]MWJ32805.1 GNAT family N-acetyltransferase [Saccharibacillus sp. WB 17]QDH21493.1 GNAT family N-acetyltransferase [Saccharibacillus brassicae]
MTQPEHSHDIVLAYEVPQPDEYIELRVAAGMSTRTPEAARRGLPNSLFAVTLRENGRLVGMGRVLGDGGCAYLISDIVVHPSMQRRGLGRRVMAEIERYLEKNVPPGSFVSLIADTPADALYRHFGFIDTAPASIGMYRPSRPKA